MVRPIDLTGPLFVGILWNWGQYGILLGQVYTYWTGFPSDKWHTKLLVYTLFVLDSLQSILLARGGFSIFADGFGNLERLNEIGFVWITVPILAAFISVIVECFFAYRIWGLSGRSPWIPAAVVVTSWTQAVGAIIAGVQAFQAKEYTLWQLHARISITVWNVGSAAADVLIAVSMCYYLWKAGTVFKRPHTALIKFIQLSIETGTVTATIAIINLALFSAGPRNTFHIAPVFVISKLYANTVVIIFNNRPKIMSRKNQSTVTDGQG